MVVTPHRVHAVLHAGDDPALLGGKAAALARLDGLPIPPWFAISPDAFYAGRTEAERRLVDARGLCRATPAKPVCRRPGPRGRRATAGAGPPYGYPCLSNNPRGTRMTEVKRQELEAAGPAAGIRMSEEVRAEVEQALAALCPHDEPVAVRSSALDEDGHRDSFAGQLESYLFVDPRDVPAAAERVFTSGMGPRVAAYRAERGLGGPLCPPAVLVQRMVDADVSGVAFSVDPVSGKRDLAVVAAVWGLGTALVSGRCDGDTYHVDRKGDVVARQIGRKIYADRRGRNEAVEPVPVPIELVEEPALDEDGVRRVAELARLVEERAGCPQDIEWAVEDGRLYLLQARPITAVPPMNEGGRTTIWDNSNIAESYPGMTTPLTFSFARRSYEAVYRRLCHVLGVPRRTIEEQEGTFRTMLGFVRGRIYYNLLSWYRLLALVPGFRLNRRFMEGMMGVRAGLPEDVAAEMGTATSRQRAADALRLMRTLIGLLAGYVTLSRRIRRFHRRLDEALGRGRPDLSGQTAEELAASYRDLERRLLGGWDAPLINDLFAMVFFGLLRKLSVSWCGDEDGRLANDLLSGEGGIISAEPAHRMQRMARLAAEHGALVEALERGTRGEIACAVEAVPAFRAEYDAYLARFGDRSPGELKLESTTLHDDPTPLYRALGRLARSEERISGAADPVERRADPGGAQWSAALPPRTSTSRNGRRATASRACPTGRRLQTAKSRGGDARAAEKTVRMALRRHPVRRLLFAFVLHGARARVRDRENLRFERTRVFGRARLIFLELGRAFQQQGVLDHPRDIVYLEVEEVLGFVDGTATCTDLRGLAAVRKAELARFAAMPAPADRFITHGPVHGDGSIHRREAEVPASSSLRGTPCCPGTVRARVRVVTDPATANVRPGEILVAERTDPGWIILFSLAGGLLVEHGSLLSHSAIVARELSIPTIVGLAGATQVLHDGDWVEMDGAAGTVVPVPAAVEVCQ